MTQLAKTSTPGIYRAHGNKCDGTGRCDCPYVIMWRHRGRQHKETCRTFNEAREKKSLRDSVDSKPVERTRFGDYFPEWIETYAGRTQRGPEVPPQAANATSLKVDVVDAMLDEPWQSTQPF